MLAGVPMTLPNYAAEESNLFGDDLPNDMPLGLTVDRFILRFHLWEVSPVLRLCDVIVFAARLPKFWDFAECSSIRLSSRKPLSLGTTPRLPVRLFS
jgi:hypothetical protein